MFVFGNLFIAIGSILDIVLNIYTWVIIIAALLSWVNPDPYNPIVRLLYGVTEPVLRPIRRRLGILGGIDLSPIVALLIIFFLRYFIVKSLIELGYKMKGGLL
ncbi:YGGT family protein [bacterium BMS3Bbin06]|nr:YGGT family protein [bacterium BMS3Bbin06]HDO35991.1 YggT family protein [Nitrospirota bacterium]HDY72090.1 YggT family protein [Nitrospirota bacterium]